MYIWCSIDGWCSFVSALDVFRGKWLCYDFDTFAAKGNTEICINDTLACHGRVDMGKITQRCDKVPSTGGKHSWTRCGIRARRSRSSMRTRGAERTRRVVPHDLEERALLAERRPKLPGG